MERVFVAIRKLFNTSQTGPENNSGAPSAWRVAYVITATLLLLAGVNLWARKLDLNPMTVAQNKNLMFLGPRSENDPVYSRLPVNGRERLSILFMGNSQTYSIMDFTPGDSNMITSLSDLLNEGQETSSSKLPVRYGSEGNLRMSEFLVKSVDAVVDSEHRPDVVLCGIVLDGLRWVDARAELAQRTSVPAIHQELTKLVSSDPQNPQAARVVEGMFAAPKVETGEQTQSLEIGVQPHEVWQSDAPDQEKGLSATRVENWFQTRLDTALPLFAKRRMFYTLFITYYLASRNALLGLNTSTRRPISPGMYQTNLQLIEMTFKYLREHNVHAVVYFAPIRPTEPNPYSPPDIARFRQDLPAICARQGAVCLDYSNLVPEEMWTNYPDYIPGQAQQRDFAHFTGRGHRRVAEQLASDLSPYLQAWRTQKLQQK